MIKILYGFPILGGYLMFKYLLKNLNVFFDLKKENSSNLKSVAKARNGTAVSNVGNNITMHVGDIKINQSNKQPRNSIDNDKAWEALEYLLNQKSAKWHVENINNPLYQQNFDHNLKGQKKHIMQKFKDACIDSEDSRADQFISIQKAALRAFDEFVESRDEKKFLQEWDSCHKQLVSLRKKID